MCTKPNCQTSFANTRMKIRRWGFFCLFLIFLQWDSGTAFETAWAAVILRELKLKTWESSSCHQSLRNLLLVIIWWWVKEDCECCYLQSYCRTRLLLWTYHHLAGKIYSFVKTNWDFLWARNQHVLIYIFIQKVFHPLTYDTLLYYK